jgi:hypothetical protein
LGEPVTAQLLVAAALMAFGVWLHLTEHHEHEHVHETLVHAHPLRCNKHGCAHIPWGIVVGIRAELDKQGVDWRGMRKDVKEAIRELDQAAQRELD